RKYLVARIFGHRSAFARNETVVYVSGTAYQYGIYRYNFMVAHHNPVADLQFGEQDVFLFPVEVYTCNSDRVKRFIVAVVRKCAISSFLEKFAQKHKEKQSAKGVEVAGSVVGKHFIDASAIKYKDAQNNRYIYIDDLIAQAKDRR